MKALWKDPIWRKQLLDKRKNAGKIISKKMKARWKDPVWREKEMHNRGVLQKENYKQRAIKCSITTKNKSYEERFGRKKAEEWKHNISKSGKGKIAWNKGLTKENDERVKKISKALIGKMVGNKNPMCGKVGYPSRIYIPELDLKVKSSWEQEIALFLHKNKLPVRYETKTFKLPNQTTYTPDFLLKDVYIEVKAYCYKKTWEKYKLFIKTFPEIKYLVLTKNKLLQKEMIEKGFICLMFEDNWIGRILKWN